MLHTYSYTLYILLKSIIIKFLQFAYSIYHFEHCYINLCTRDTRIFVYVLLIGYLLYFF